MPIDLDNPPDEAKPYVELYEGSQRLCKRLDAENRGLRAQIDRAEREFAGLLQEELERLAHLAQDGYFPTHHEVRALIVTANRVPVLEASLAEAMAEYEQVVEENAILRSREQVRLVREGVKDLIQACEASRPDNCECDGVYAHEGYCPAGAR